MFNKGIYRPPSTGGGSSAFNGDRGIKRSPNSGLNVGGATTNEFLENFFFPFVKSSISLNSGTTYYEIGTTQSIALSGTITANDEDTFTNAQIIVDGDANDVINLPNVAGSYSVQDDGVEVNCSYESKVTGAGSGGYTVDSATKYIRFIYAAFSGKNTTGATPTAAQIKAGTKSIALKTSYFSANLNTSGSEYGWFAVPKNQTNKVYTAWYVTALNNGSIGAGQFIKSPVTVDVDGVDYDVYVYAYSSALSVNLKLS